MKKLFSLFVVALFAMSAWADTQYCGHVVTGTNHGHKLTISFTKEGESTYSLIMESDAAFTGYNAPGSNFHANNITGDDSGKTHVSEHLSQNGNILTYSVISSTTPNLYVGDFYVNYSDGEEHYMIPTDEDWSVTCSFTKDYTITAYVPDGNAAPYIHFWGEDFDPGTWPQMTATAYANTYTYTVTDAPMSGIQVLFSHSSKNTADQALITEDAFYNVYWSGDTYTAVPTTAHNMIDVTIKVNADQTPKIHFWGVADAPADFASDPDMTLVAGYTDWYEYTVSNVDENNGVNYLIRLGSEQSADQNTLTDVCLNASIDNNEVTLSSTECPAQVVPDAPHASGKGFGTYQATGVALYNFDGDFAGTIACGSVSLYVVTVGNVIYYKAIAENEGTFQDGTDYFCQLRTRKDDDTEMREHWAREMSNDKTTRWTAFGGANNPDLAPYGDVMHLNTYMVMTGCGARTIQTIEYHRDYINNPIIDVVAPTLTSAVKSNVTGGYQVDMVSPATEEIFYYLVDETSGSKYVSLTSSITIPSDESGTPHTISCYAVDFNGNMSSKIEVTLEMTPFSLDEAATQPDFTNKITRVVYSDATSPVVNNNFSKNQWSWITYTENEIAGDHQLLYNTNNTTYWTALGSDAGNTAIEANAGYNDGEHTGLDVRGMTYMHVDLWVDRNASNVNVFLRNDKLATVNLTEGWNYLDLALDAMPEATLSNIQFIKFDGFNVSSVKHFALDNIYFWKEAPKAYDLTTADTDWYSLYLDYAVTIPSGMAAYTGEVSNDALNVTAIETGVIPANTAVLVKSTAAGTYTFDETTSAAFNGTNDLKGVLEATTVESILTANPNHKLLVLGSKEGVVGFYNKETNSVAANRAYLLVNVPAGETPAPIRIIEVENTATAIDALEGSANDVVKFIENGKILIMKNGVVYDVLGNVIR